MPALDKKRHVYIGRPCLEDLIEYMMFEEGVKPRPRTRPRQMEPVPEEEMMREALNRLDDSRSRFHDQFSGWGGLIRLSSLPEGVAQAILDTTTMG